MTWLISILVFLFWRSRNVRAIFNFLLLELPIQNELTFILLRELIEIIEFESSNWRGLFILLHKNLLIELKINIAFRYCCHGAMFNIFNYMGHVPSFNLGMDFTRYYRLFFLCLYNQVCSIPHQISDHNHDKSLLMALSLLYIAYLPIDWK